MNKLLTLVSAVAFVFCFSGVGFGALFTIADVTSFSEGTTDSAEDLISFGGKSVNKLEYSGDWVKWTHHYDFTPPADTILSGELGISLRDDDDMDTSTSWKTWEIGIGWGEDGTWGLGEVDTGTYEYNVNVGFLADGRFTVKLVSLLGDFFIDSSKLSIKYESGSVSVPDSSIMFLLGPSLIILGILSRKKYRK